MIIPQRCFTCGKVLSDKWDAFDERAREGDEDPGEVLDDLGIDRYCCRTVFLTHVDLHDDISAYMKQ